MVVASVGVPSSGKTLYSVYHRVEYCTNDSLINKNVFSFSFIEKKKEHCIDGHITFRQKLSELNFGAHMVDIEIYAVGVNEVKSEFPIATRSLTFETKPNTKITGYSFSSIPDKMKNEALKAKIHENINEELKEASSKLTIMDLKFIFNDWQIYRDKNTSVILGREIWMAVLYKDVNGKCNINVESYFQDFDGKNYQESINKVKENEYFPRQTNIVSGACDCQ